MIEYTSIPEPVTRLEALLTEALKACGEVARLDLEGPQELQAIKLWRTLDHSLTTVKRIHEPMKAYGKV